MKFGDFLKMDPEEIKVRKRSARPTLAHQDKTKFDKKKDRKGFRSNLRKGIHEAQTLTNVRLTDHQKSVLANILGRDNQNTTLVDLVSGVEAAHKNNLATAVKTLEQIGLIQLSGKELTITDTGMEVMSDEGLVDESGMLNDEGQKFQFMYTDGEEGKTQADVDQEMGMDVPDMGMGDPPMDLGLPESAGSVSLMGWMIVDKSFIGGGSDPTEFTKYVLRNKKHHLTIEEAFGDWYITDHNRAIADRRHMTYKQLNQVLQQYGAPTLDAIESRFKFHESVKFSIQDALKFISEHKL